MNIIEKLKKLIAHEQSAHEIGNQDEAKAFAETIQKLLDKYNLSRSDIEVDSEQQSPIGYETIVPVGAFLDWQEILIDTISGLNGCCTLLNKSPFGLIIIGRQSDREIVISLYRYFEQLCLELGEKFVKDQYDIYHGDFFLMYGMDERKKSFMLGLVISISERFNATHKSSVETAAPGTALVFMGNRQKDSQNFADAQFNPAPASYDKPSSIDISSFNEGQKLGNQITLTDKTIK